MPTERFTFEGHSGEMLAARLDLPDGPHLATALFAHCFTCSKDIPAARRIASRLAAMGIAVLRFDFTGLGHSEGEFANTTFSSNVEDLRRAAAELGALHALAVEVLQVQRRRVPVRVRHVVEAEDRLGNDRAAEHVDIARVRADNNARSLSRSHARSGTAKSQHTDRLCPL